MFSLSSSGWQAGRQLIMRIRLSHTVSSSFSSSSFFLLWFHKREYWLPIPHLIYHTNTIVLCVCCVWAEARERSFSWRPYRYWVARPGFLSLSLPPPLSFLSLFSSTLPPLYVSSPTTSLSLLIISSSSTRYYYTYDYTIWYCRASDEPCCHLIRENWWPSSHCVHSLRRTTDSTN